MLLAVTFSNVLDVIATALGAIWQTFTDCVTMLTSNMLIFVPVILAFTVSLIMLAISVMKKLGLRGLGGGRRRRRR